MTDVVQRALDSIPSRTDAGLKELIKNAERLGEVEVAYAAAAELSRRGSTFDIKRTVEVLTEVASERDLLGYKELFEIHSDEPWNHTKVAAIARHLEAVAYFCMDNNIPVLTTLVVHHSGGKYGDCGDGWVIPYQRRGRPHGTSAEERERCYEWGIKSREARSPTS